MPDRGMVRWSDAELLTRLADALAPDDRQPTEAGLSALRASLDARTSWPAAARVRRKPWTSWAGRSRRGLVALGLIGGVCLGGTSAAVATGSSLPEPVRVVAHHLGLPVGSPPRVRALNPERARRPARTASASTRPAPSGGAAGGVTAGPGEVNESDLQTSRPTPPRPPLGPGPVESGQTPYQVYPPDRSSEARTPPGTGPAASDNQPQSGVPATSGPSSADPAARVGPEQHPSGPGAGGEPRGDGSPAAAVWAGGEQPGRQTAASG
jgi:hypothetical protein